MRIMLKKISDKNIFIKTSGLDCLCGFQEIA